MAKNTPDVARPEPAEGRAWFALAIFAAALSVRLVHVWQIRRSPFFSLLMGDSGGYDEWARRIAGADWFGHEVFYQAPLYPYMLGVIYAVAGRHLLLVRIVQALVGSASCALLALAAARLFSRKAGIVAGLMLALYAPAIFFDGLLQKSVLDVFFVCLALWLIARITVRLKPDTTGTTTGPATGPTTGPTTGTPTPRDSGNGTRVPCDVGSVRLQPDLSWLWLGLTMGGLALTRENALVFIVVILAWIIVEGLGIWGAGLPARRSAAPGPKSLAPTLRRVGLFLTGLAIVLVPVAARNSYVGGGFYITTSQFGPNFFIGNNPAADGTYQSLRFGRGAPEYERQDATDLAERARGRRLTPAEVSSYWTDRALNFITSKPGAWLALMGRKIALLWNATEMLDTESQEAHAEWSWPLRVGGVAGHFGLLVPLAVFGLVVTWRMRSRVWILYAMTLAYAASVVLFYVFARYRYPLVPLLILFAAAGLVDARDFFVARGSSPAVAGPKACATPWWTLAIVAAVAVFCNWPILSKTLMRAVTENNVAVALQAQGRIEEATDHYRRAIALQPDYAPAYNNLGTALRASGRLDEAAATYQRALAVRPEYPEAHYNLANVLTDAGKPGEAAEHFRVALQKLPGSADVHNNLGIALMGQGKTDEAVAEFRAALQADPGSAKSHRNLADALASAKRYDEAIGEFRRAAELDPGGAAHYDLGSLLLELNRPDAAIVEFLAALEATPASAPTHNNLGIALGMQGRLDDAMAQFEQALTIDPGFEDARRNLALARKQQRR